METMTRTLNDGTTVNYSLTKEKGWFARHIWVYRNGTPYLHIMPTKKGTGRVFKNCEAYGWLSMCEIMADFDSIKLNDVIGL